MKIRFYKILLVFLKTLVYTKRGLFWFLGLFWKLLLDVNNIYKITIGFRIYKVFFYIGKRIKKYLPVSKQKGLGFLGERGTLQLVLLGVMVILLIPHSRLYTSNVQDIPGRKTLLYKLVGPGDQDFQLENFSVELVQAPVISAPTWHEGVVGENTNIIINKQGIQEISSVSAGGSALTKPIIIPGADINMISAASGSEINAITNRSEVVYYKVKSGDVLGLISEKYGVSIETILWANNLSYRSFIRPGQELKILPADGVMYKVSKGDNISKIAKKYSAKPEEIIEFNKLNNDGANIAVGEELFVPNGIMPQAVYTAPKQLASQSNAFSSITPPPPSVLAPADSGYLWPTAATIITQYFGLRHNGLDIASKTGTAIYATRSGTVKKSECNNKIGYGCYILLDHGDGVTSLYGHASELYVSVGDYVEQGQTIMAMGSTGRSTGPHLHFEVRVNGVHQNPLKYVRK